MNSVARQKVAMKVQSEVRLPRSTTPFSRIRSNWPKSCRGLVIALLLLASVSSWSSPITRPVRVLMLYFGGRDSLALDRFQAGIRSEFEQELDVPVTIYTESFDEEGLGRSRLYAVAMEQFLRKKYADREIDIVVPVGEYPLEFIQGKRKTLFPNAKLLYLTIGLPPHQPVPDATGMVLPIDIGPHSRDCAGTEPWNPASASDRRGKRGGSRPCPTRAR